MERGIRKIEIMLGNCFNRFLLQLPIYTINIGLLNYTKQPQKNLRLLEKLEFVSGYSPEIGPYLQDPFQ